MIIREATPEDIPQILKNSKTSDRFRMSEHTNEIDEEEIRYWINDSRSIVLVAEIDRKVIGYAYGIIMAISGSLNYQKAEKWLCYWV